MEFDASARMHYQSLFSSRDHIRLGDFRPRAVVCVNSTQSSNLHRCEQKTASGNILDSVVVALYADQIWFCDDTLAPHWKDSDTEQQKKTTLNSLLPTQLWGPSRQNSDPNRPPV